MVPFIAPYLFIDIIAYSEQVGEYLHLGKKNGDIAF
tara:strand:- start:513 stop:620 length:108 start_codon:yes stop_codon:yes gene_type:complete